MSTVSIFASYMTQTLTPSSNNVDRQCIISKEGQLFLCTESGLLKTWVILRGITVYCYKNEENHENPIRRIDLRGCSSISSEGWRSKCFHLKSNSGNKLIKFQAISIHDKTEWIQSIRKELADSYGTTVKLDNQIESASSIWFAALCGAMIVLFAIASVKTQTKFLHIFCIPLALYQISLIMLCGYYCCRYKWKKANNLIKFNKFWIQSLLCSLFNIITFLLLIIHLSRHNQAVQEYTWFFANSVVYLFGAISIPFPAICMKLHRENKYEERSKQSITSFLQLPSPEVSQDIINSDHDEKQQTINDEDSISGSEGDPVKVWLVDTVKLPQYYKIFKMHAIDDMSIVEKLTEDQLKEMNITKIGDRIRIMDRIRVKSHSAISFALNINVSAASRPIFSDNILKGVICICYFVHFLAYIGNPLFNHQAYLLMNSIMYPGYNDGNLIYIMLHDINQIFLRTFQGMSLTSVFFIFVTELTDKQITSTRYRVLWRIWNDKLNCFWIMVVILIIIMVPFEIFIIRDLVREYLSLNSIMMDMIINIIWITINLFVANICIKFWCLFSGIYTKTKYAYSKFYRAQTPTSPIKAFVLEAITLGSLYTVYVVFMILYNMVHFDEQHAKTWDVFRQCAILIVSILQFWTLIRVKQTQKFGEFYLKRFEIRPNWILHGYYKLNCLLIVYNSSYIFIFKVQYFGAVFTKYISNDRVHIYANIAYAFSFSLSASMLFILSHFIASYQQWKEDEQHRTLSEDLTISTVTKNENDDLNKFMKSQKSTPKMENSAQLLENPLLD